MSYLISIIDPYGNTRVVRCRDTDQCLEVVGREGKSVEPLTIFLMGREEKGGGVTPLARWSRTKRGLVRGTSPRRSP